MFLAVSWCCWLNTSSSYAYSTSSWSRHRRRAASGWVLTSVTRSTEFRTRPLRATIYDPSGDWNVEDEYCGLDEDDPYNLNLNNDNNNKSDYLKDILSQSSLAALARLAVAFSPPGMALDLRHIQHVTVIRVDENHIDIEAVVCEEDGCVTLAVPITFPRPCNNNNKNNNNDCNYNAHYDDDDLEECVMDNIGQLDIKAGQVLKKLEWEESHYEEIQDVHRQMHALQSPQDLTLPTWWVHGADLSLECGNICCLLNEEDFQQEVCALAASALSDANHDNDWTVEQAAVVAVGPAGVVLRALTTARLDMFAESTKKQIVEVPIAFSATVHDVAELRAAVLGAMASAGGN
jgi:hypothetical protein